MTTELDPQRPAARHRRRAAAHRAGQPADQRPPGGARAQRRRPSARPAPAVTLVDTPAGRSSRGDRRSAITASASAPTICRASSIRTSRPAAPAPASACRSPRTSSTGSAARSPSPARQAPAPRIRIELGDAPAARSTDMTPPGSILLADDEEKILKTLGRALREDGHDVVTTPSALEAQRLLVERSFDLLVDRLPDARTHRARSDSRARRRRRPKASGRRS